MPKKIAKEETIHEVDIKNDTLNPEMKPLENVQELAIPDISMSLGIAEAIMAKGILRNADIHCAEKKLPKGETVSLPKIPFATYGFAHMVSVFVFQ